MLFSAPYELPEKKTKKAVKGTKGGLRCKGVSDVMSQDAETPSFAGDNEEEEEARSPLIGEKKKSKASAHGEAEAPKKGKIPIPDYSAAATNSSEEWGPRVNPLAKS